MFGGQFGSEGKGKIVSHLSLNDDVDVAVRCGGPNSGHTVDYGGERHAMRLIPAGFINQKTRLLIAAGAIINPRILFEEISECKINPKRIGIDKNTAIITDKDSIAEKNITLRERTGSTLSGTGIGVSKRVLRDPSLKLAKDIDELKPFITDVSEEVNSTLDEGKKVIIEGTQGFGLSVYHTQYFPYATSRDTSVAAFLSEVGVSPFMVSDVIMCVRTFPIRVAGNSGPLPNEITWEKLQEISGYPYPIREFTTTTHKLRRVAKFDLSEVERSTRVNRPTSIALHASDYIDYANESLTDFEELTESAKSFIQNLEQALKTPIDFVGTGITNEDIIDRRIEEGKRYWKTLAIKN